MGVCIQLQRPALFRSRNLRFCACARLSTSNTLRRSTLRPMEITYSELIQTVGVFGTLLIAAVAIWGEQIRHLATSPKLKIRLHDPEGGLTWFGDGAKA